MWKVSLETNYYSHQYKRETEKIMLITKSHAQKILMK